MNQDYYDNIRGAVYISSRAYNAYQMWRDYKGQEARRDLEYASLVNLNALRIWVSYEFWREEPNLFKLFLDDFLTASHERGMRIMPSLFEDCGLEPSEENLKGRDPMKTVAVRSPGKDIEQNDSLWSGPEEFVRWMMENYGDDSRILAMEVMNEPQLGHDNYPFAYAMVKVSAENRGSVPLTLGCCNLEDNALFREAGIDVFQYHYNFPTNLEEFTRQINKAKAVENLTGIPVWLTEWQRTRSSEGWDEVKLAGGDFKPALHTLAEVIGEHEIGNFFWSLMIKPAYLQAQRPNGTFNGLFHEDGSVYSLEDARSVSGNPHFEAEEFLELPLWYQRDLSNHD